MRLAISFVFLLPLAACSSYGERPDTGQPVLHAVHDEHLRELMVQMNSLLFERTRPETDIDRARRQYAGQIEATAQELSATVDAIITTLPSLRLNPSEQARFMALAGKLRDQAQRLSEQARGNQIDIIPATLDQMASICRCCHELFRKP